jgi:hypothetical protein
LHRLVSANISKLIGVYTGEYGLNSNTCVKTYLNTNPKPNLIEKQFFKILPKYHRPVSAIFSKLLGFYLGENGLNSNTYPNPKPNTDTNTNTNPYTSPTPNPRETNFFKF